MKSITNLVGIILIILGIVTLVYRGYSYNSQEQVAKIGNIQVTAEEKKTVYFPPMLGALSIVAGIILVVVARKK